MKFQFNKVVFSVEKPFKATASPAGSWNPVPVKASQVRSLVICRLLDR